MPRLSPCPTCHEHVLSDERECPHCGATIRRSSARVPAVLMGLALTGCPGIADPEPEYGVPDTSPDDADTTADVGTDTGTSSGGTETGTDTGTTSVGEPEYGVPETGP